MHKAKGLSYEHTRAALASYKSTKEAHGQKAIKKTGKRLVSEKILVRRAQKR